MFNTDKILKEVKYVLDCSKNCDHVEIHVTLDADKPYADINVESHTITYGV